jgi:hypothetical protein
MVRMSTAALKHKYGVNELTVCFIMKNDNKIRGSMKVSAPSCAKISSVSCQDHFLEKTEKALCVWLQDANRRCHGTTQGVCK